MAWLCRRVVVVVAAVVVVVAIVVVVVVFAVAVVVAAAAVCRCLFVVGLRWMKGLFSLITHALTHAPCARAHDDAQ